MKTSDTYADTLLAFGAAEFLTKMAGDGAARVIDRGGVFAIEGGAPDLDRAATGSLLLYPFVSLIPGDDDGIPGEVFRYCNERERIRERKTRPTRMKRGRRSAATSAAGLPNEVADAAADHAAIHPLASVVARANELDKAETIKRGNRLRQDCLTLGRDGIQAVVAALEAGWVPASEALSSRFETETLGQVLNPHAGKGTNRGKPNGARRDNLEAPAVEEWLKYAGFFSHAYARRVPRGRNSADVEILVPIPTDIAIDASRDVMRALREHAIAGISVKFEILTVLAYAEILVRHHEAHFTDALRRRRRVNKIVSGIQVAYFQDLGGGKSVTGLYTLGLPGWFDLNGGDDVAAYLDVLDDHRRCLYALDEDKSDHVALLLRYRDFLSQGDLRAFGQFLIDHGELVLKSWAAGERPRRFAENGLTRIVAGEAAMKLSAVIEDEGFRNVAKAIRRSTVGEVTQQTLYKGRLSGVRYEVRYGLGQELKRRARRSEEFIGALASFIQSYNEENARIREQFSKQDKDLPAHRRRADISDVELDAVVRIIENAANPEAVALLLVAYGFTRAQREETPDTAAAPER